MSRNCFCLELCASILLKPLSHINRHHSSKQCCHIKQSLLPLTQHSLRTVIVLELDCNVVSVSAAVSCFLSGRPTFTLRQRSLAIWASSFFGVRVVVQCSHWHFTYGHTTRVHPRKNRGALFCTHMGIRGLPPLICGCFTHSRGCLGDLINWIYGGFSFSSLKVIALASPRSKHYFLKPPLLFFTVRTVSAGKQYQLCC